MARSGERERRAWVREDTWNLVEERRALKAKLEERSSRLQQTRTTKRIMRGREAGGGTRGGELIKLHKKQK